MYFDFHSEDHLLIRSLDSRHQYVKEQIIKDWNPFLSFPILKACNFRCMYCGIGGEATASLNGAISMQTVKIITQQAISHGITKFRVTGGEPFLHPEIVDILQYFSELGFYTLINTNGSMISNFKKDISRLNDNIRFAVSLDTLVPEKLTAISGRNCLKSVLSGIDFLSQCGLLLRCNMVVGKHNIDEVFPIIRFCQDKSCDLKLLDIVSVPLPYGKRSDYYQEIVSLEEQLREECDEVFSHEYSRLFGTPCYRYRFDNVFVTVKNSRMGSHYDISEGGICEKCKYFPCHEGLYDIFALSDSRLCACRWTEKQACPDIESQMEFLLDAFKRSVYCSKEQNDDMARRSDLLLDEKTIRSLHDGVS